MGNKKHVSAVGVLILITSLLSAGFAGLYLAMNSSIFVILALVGAALTAVLAIAGIIGSGGDGGRNTLFSTGPSESELTAADMLKRMADGEFERRDSYSGSDPLLSVVERLRLNMNDSLAEIAANADNVSKAASRASTLSAGIEGEVSRQSSAAVNISGAAATAADIAAKSAENARGAGSLVAAASDDVKKGSEQLQKLSRTVDEIGKSQKDVLKYIKEIEEAAMQLGELANGKLSSKSSAVPADETKKFAVRALEAAHTASNLINNCADSAKAGMDISGETSAALASAIEKTRSAAGTLDSVSRDCDRQKDTITKLGTDISRVGEALDGANAGDCTEALKQAVTSNEKVKTKLKSFRTKTVTIPLSLPKESAVKKPAASAFRKPAAAPAKPAATAARPASSTAKPTAPKPSLTSTRPAAPAAKPAVTAAKPAPAPRPSTISAPQTAERKSEPMPTALPENFNSPQFIDVPDSKY